MRTMHLLVLAQIAALVIPIQGYADEVARGESVYMGSCIACHGADGSGSLPGVPDLTQQGGPLSQDDSHLLKRVIEGFQSPGSPMQMPARGGNSGLSDADLKAAIAYMKQRFKRTQ